MCWSLVPTIRTYAPEQTMQYREKAVSSDCTPPSAQNSTKQTVRYRLLDIVKPTQKDFGSYAKQKGH